jgi:hypothetical protein
MNKASLCNRVVKWLDGASRDDRLLASHVRDQQIRIGSQAVTEGAFLCHSRMVGGLNMNVQSEEMRLIMNGPSPLWPLVRQGIDALNPLEAERIQPGEDWLNRPDAHAGGLGMGRGAGRVML